MQKGRERRGWPGGLATWRLASGGSTAGLWTARTGQGRPLGGGPGPPVHGGPATRALSRGPSWTARGAGERRGWAAAGGARRDGEPGHAEASRGRGRVARDAGGATRGAAAAGRGRGVRSTAAGGLTAAVCSERRLWRRCDQSTGWRLRCPRAPREACGVRQPSYRGGEPRGARVGPAPKEAAAALPSPKQTEVGDDRWVPLAGPTRQRQQVGEGSARGKAAVADTRARPVSCSGSRGERGRGAAGLG